MATTYNERSRAAGTRYSSVAIALHWLIAFMIIGSLIGALAFNSKLNSSDAEVRAQGLAMLDIHRSFGLTILALSVFRLVWRLRHPLPSPPPTMAAYELVIARGTHLSFYALMILVPLAGYVTSSASAYPIIYFGLFEVPKLPIGQALGDVAHQVHWFMAIGIVVLLFGHVAGALKHHFINRDDVLTRILPTFRSRR